MPKVSVIIPTYNRANYICEAIDSVLAQTYQNFEIIVVDDGSTDNTRELLSEYGNKIRYIYQENRGAAAARNRGIKEVIGEYIAFLDSDDIWLPEKLELQTKILDSKNEVGLVYSRMPRRDKDGKFFGMCPENLPGNNSYDLLISESHYPTPTLLIRKECFEKVGVFDEAMKNIQDLDLCYRITKFYKIHYMDKPLAIFRSHSEHLSMEKENSYKCHLLFWEKIQKDEMSKRREIKKLLKRKQSKYNYLLGKLYFMKKDYVLARLHFVKAVKINLFVGECFFNKEEG